jgi:hypothetical protein
MIFKQECGICSKDISFKRRCILIRKSYTHCENCGCVIQPTILWSVYSAVFVSLPAFLYLQDFLSLAFTQEQAFFIGILPSLALSKIVYPFARLKCINSWE